MNPTARAGGFDLKSVLRQLTTPMVESLDSRLRDQIEAHVDELLDEKVDAAIRDRLSTLDRAVADLSRSLDQLEGATRRLVSHEALADAMRYKGAGWPGPRSRTRTANPPGFREPSICEA